MKRTPAPDHTRMRNCENGDPEFYCLHCAATIRVSLPIEMNAFSTIISAFAKAHRRCPPPTPKEPT